MQKISLPQARLRRTLGYFGVTLLFLFSLAGSLLQFGGTAHAAEYSLAFKNGVTIEVKNITLGAGDWDRIDSSVRNAFSSDGSYSSEALKAINDRINQYAEGDYVDKKMDSNWDFELNKEGCKSRLSDDSGSDGFDGSLTFKEITISHPDFGCKDLTGGEGSFDVPSGSVDAKYAKVYFEYASKTEIVPVDEGSGWGSFSPIDGEPDNRFYRTSEEGQSCQDYIEVTSQGAEIDKGKMYERDAEDNTGGSRTKEGNCYIYEAAELGSRDLQIGSVVNRDDDPDNNVSTSGGGGGDAPEVTCETELTNPLTWIACPIIHGAVEGIQKFDDYITQELTIDADEYMDQNSELGSRFYAAWSGFRFLSLGLLIIVGLVMIFGQALSLDVFDAYTVKKIMPRLIAAVIFVTLSWPLMKLAIELTNLFGVGIRSLLYAPFADLGNVDFSGGLATIVGGAGIVGAGSVFIGLGVFGILSLVVTGLLAVIIGFAVIVFRRILVMLLVVVAPFAIVCSILPNTQKVWKLWWDFFSKALIAFPIIALFIASGRVFAQVATSGDSSTIEGVIAFIAYFGPYFAIPAAFRMAGGAIATVSGLANDRSKGAFDRLKAGRAERRKQRFGAASDSHLWNAKKYGKDTLRGKVVRGANTAASMATSNPWDTGRLLAGTAGGKAIGAEIAQRKFQHSQALSEGIIKSGISNDRALKALSGQNEKIGSVRNAADIQRAISVLSQGDDSDRVAASQLQNAYGFLANAHKSEEYGSADMEGAALMAWSSQGFANADDIADVANRIGGGEGASIANQASFLGYKAGRLDLKPTYGVVADENGHFSAGTQIADDATEEERVAAIGRQAKLVKGLKNHEIIGMKGNGVKNIKEGVKQLVRDGDPARIDFERKQLYAAGADSETIQKFEEEATTRVGRAKAMRDNLIYLGSSMNTGDVDAKAQWQEAATELDLGGAIADYETRARRSPSGDPTNPGAIMGGGGGEE